VRTRCAGHKIPAADVRACWSLDTDAAVLLHSLVRLCAEAIDAIKEASYYMKARLEDPSLSGERIKMAVRRLIIPDPELDMEQRVLRSLCSFDRLPV
jgi:hypothetical protein